MKFFVFIVLAGFMIFSMFGPSCTPPSEMPSSIADVDTPVVVEGREDLFQAGRIYFGGQPDEEMLRWLADEGVRVVINLRTKEEMETHTKEKFDEVDLVKQLGLRYFSFPLGGKVGYSPQAVDTLAETLDQHQAKTFIHCTYGGRVSYLWVAYLIKYKGLSIEAAINIGKIMKFRFVLEDLLGYRISMRKEEV